jgi:hypothetical protein
MSPPIGAALEEEMVFSAAEREEAELREAGDGVKEDGVWLSAEVAERFKRGEAFG